MPYIIDRSEMSFSDMFRDKSIIDFIENSISIARGLDAGKFEKIVYNDELFCIAQNSILKHGAECVFESHKRYVDIHIVVDGFEHIELSYIDEDSVPYEENEELDYYLYKNFDVKKEVKLDNTKIGVFLFNDAHKVGIKSASSNENAVKIVLKITKILFDKEFII